MQVKDSANATATRQLSITISASALIISTPSLPSASQNAPYTQTLTATGGTGGYRWSLASGALPGGLVLDQSGRISGTVTGSTSTFSVQVTDSASVTATKNFTITVAAGPSIPKCREPAWWCGRRGVLDHHRGERRSGPHIPCRVVSGQLPPGLSLNAASGEISGSPTQAGSFPFTLQVRDAAGARRSAPSHDRRHQRPDDHQSTDPSRAPACRLLIRLPFRRKGERLRIPGPMTAGTLPAGLSFHTDGKIDGTPSAAGSFNFTASVTDANSARSSKDFTLPVAAGLSITTAPQLPPAVPGSPYSTTSGGSRRDRAIRLEHCRRMRFPPA